MKLFSNPTPSTLLIGITLGTLVWACSGSSDSASGTTTSAALESAQCSIKGFGRETDACVATYETCAAATGADEQACRTALVACLPTGEPGDHGDRGACDGGAGKEPGPRPDDDGDGVDGGSRGPGGPGGPGGPPPGDRDGDHGRGGHGGPGRGPHPDPAAMKACHDSLAACLGGTDPVTTCLDNAKSCVKSAFDAAFQAACADAATRCASTTPPDDCDRILQRCAQGVQPPPDANPAVTCN